MPQGVSGQSVLIAEPRSRVGEVLGNNRVIYRDAFDGGFRASAVYTWTRGGLEQDVVFSEALPAPSEYQLMDDPAFIMLEIWTEFLDPVDPQRTPAIMEREPDVRNARRWWSPIWWTKPWTWAR